MRPFSRDHPHVRSPDGVMSCEEIRFWIRELTGNPQWGWAGHSTVLARALGIHDSAPAGTLLGKIRERNQAWIYPGEQIRFSRQLRLVIFGHLVCRKVGQRFAAVVATDPKPLKVPPRMRYDLATGKLGFERPMAPSTAPMLPSFAQVFSGVKTWVPPSRSAP